ncbi:MAG: hypothetical protein AABN34_27550 [Acidobacteriota bacterium]
MRRQQDLNRYADIVAFDGSGQLVLIVEVKCKFGTSDEWAKRMRRNLYAHGLLPSVPFFLLALPDRFYLWKNAGSEAEALEPTMEIDPAAFLGPYYDRAGVAPDELTGKTFELIVAGWLNAVIRADSLADLEGDNLEWLATSGLLDSLSGGRLELEAAA